VQGKTKALASQVRKKGESRNTKDRKTKDAYTRGKINHKSGQKRQLSEKPKILKGKLGMADISGGGNYNCESTPESTLAGHGSVKNGRKWGKGKSGSWREGVRA